MSIHMPHFRMSVPMLCSCGVVCVFTLLECRREEFFAGEICGVAAIAARP